MIICSKCGAQVDENAKFCGSCGYELLIMDQSAKTNARKTKYEGTVYKCAHCGAVLSSYVKNCPECGYEIRGTEGAESVRDFERRYTAADSNSKKIDLIRTFTIPNTKEDILEFAILASSNIDKGSFFRENEIVTDNCTQQEVTEAWMAKFEQAYQKAALVLADTPELKEIEKIYKKKSSEIESVRTEAKKKAFLDKYWPALTYLGLMIFLLIALLIVSIFFPENKFDKQVAEVQECIDVGDFEKALTLAYSIKASGSKEEKIQADLITRVLDLKGETEGLAKIPNADYEDSQYTDIVTLFQKAGFTDVTTEKVPDLITGWLHKEGEVIEVSIDGSTEFTKGAYMDPGVKVIIRYHTFKE